MIPHGFVMQEKVSVILSNQAEHTRSDALQTTKIEVATKTITP